MAESVKEPNTTRSADAQVRVDHLMNIADFFGRQVAECPSCNNPLPKFPKRKTKCKSCEEYVYPKKNPITLRQVLISEDDFHLLEELSALAAGDWDRWYENNQEIESIRAQLALEWGLDSAAKVPVADAEWRRISMKATTALADGDWIAYRYAREEGIRQLSREYKYSAALPLICEYIYLTYNVDRLGGLGIEGMPLKMYPPQVVMVDFVAPNIEELREAYSDEMNHSALPHVFKMPPETAFELYEQERNEHYVCLRESGSLDSYLESIARAHEKSK